jgi:hypothetical protein
MNAIMLSPNDNVAVALKDILRGQQVEILYIDPVIARENVTMGHKVSVSVIRKGQPVVKQGESVLVAEQDIEMGQWVHEHNAIVIR